MKNIVFWDVGLCISWVNRCFGGTYRLHLQGKKNPRVVNQREQVAADCGTSQKTTFFKKSVVGISLHYTMKLQFL
jgi:hypothetical protein